MKTQHEGEKHFHVTDEMKSLSKEEVYKNSPQTLDQLENSIRVDISDIPRELLFKTCESLRERLVKLRRNGGAHFEG